MKARIFILITACVLFLGACSNGGGSSDGPVGPARAPVNTAQPASGSSDITGEFTYDFAVNGCSTGKQKFNSKKAYCDALLNDSQNRSCARELRVEAYNRACTGTKVTQVGSLAPMSTARCVVSGMDLKDRTFLDNLNPFNPQRLQSFRDIYWDGKREQGYDVMFSAAYGKARFIMVPASSPYPALGEIRVQQRKNEDLFSVRAALGAQVRMAVTNYEQEKEIEVTCRSDKAFRASSSNSKRVKCTYSAGDGRSASREELINWDQKTMVAKEVYRGRGKEALIVRLLPAEAGTEERIEVEAVELDEDRTMKAESSLADGIEVRYQGKETRRTFSLACAAASK